MTSVLWSGPFAPFQAPGATIPGAALASLPCKGDGSPSCGQIANAMVDAEGRRLPNLLRSGLIIPEPGPPIDSEDPDLCLGAFSAGGSLVKRVCLSAADRAAIRVVALADATYAGWLPNGQPEAPEGFVLYALDALTGPHLVVATASSSPNGQHPNGSQVLEAIKNEVERRSGLAFEEGGELVGVDPQPARVWHLGGVVLADYQGLVTHGQHATVLAPQIWQNVIAPWLAGETRPGPRETAPAPPPEDPWWPNALALLVAAGAGYAGVRWAQRSLRA